ncbi:unnamed protein product [Withania somnifera]
MGKRKGREQSKGSIISSGNEVNLDEQGVGGSRFFACYLLTSMCPRFKGHTYIGFTVNPRRRIRQHNGEVSMGAWRTKKKRPWEMVLCIYGFPTNISALQFEWAWQHPVESRAVRQTAASFKTLGGVANKIKLAYTMLTLPEWQSLNLTVNFFSTKYKMHSAVCPSLPEHMRVQVRALDELPCYTGIDRDEYTTNDWDNSEEYEGSSEELTYGRSASSTESNSSLSYQDKDVPKETVDEDIDWREELGKRAYENSFPDREDLEHSYIIVDSPEKTSPLILKGSFHTEDDKDKNKLDDEFDGNRLYSTKTDHDPLPTKNAALSSEVEVIDVFTPPCNKVRADSKIRRISTTCPEIIDLTDSSPIYIECNLSVN